MQVSIGPPNFKEIVVLFRVRLMVGREALNFETEDRNLAPDPSELRIYGDLPAFQAGEEVSSASTRSKF